MISISNLKISSIYTRCLVSHGGFDDNYEIFLSEYNIDEALDIA